MLKELKKKKKKKRLSSGYVRTYKSFQTDHQPKILFEICHLNSLSHS